MVFLRGLSCLITLPARVRVFAGANVGHSIAHGGRHVIGLWQCFQFVCRLAISFRYTLKVRGVFSITRRGSVQVIMLNCFYLFIICCARCYGDTMYRLACQACERYFHCYVGARFGQRVVYGRNKCCFQDRDERGVYFCAKTRSIHGRGGVVIVTLLCGLRRVTTRLLTMLNGARVTCIHTGVVRPSAAPWT